MKYLLTIITLFLASSVYAGTDDHTQNSKLKNDRTAVAAMKGWNISVENTPKAKLRSAMDIIDQISQVYNVLGKLHVEGRGEAEVYINSRKLNQLTELWHTPASQVTSISIITSPGAQYGKDVQAVIVVYVKEAENNGLRMTEFIRLDADKKVKPNNELTLGYRHGALNIGSFFGWNETYSETETNSFTFYYDHDKLTRTNQTESSSMNRTKQLTAKASIDYDISKLHHVSASYTFERNPYVTSVSYTTHSYDSIPDNDDPTSYIMMPGSSNVSGKSRHIVNADYRGMMGRWKLTLGNNTQWDESKSYTYPDLSIIHRDYLISECKTRSYLNANGLVGLGDVDAGIEYLTDNIDILYDPHRTNERNGIWYVTHTHNRDNTLALYASTTQKWNQWTLIAGLRFENVRFKYTPYENDGALLYLDYLSHLFGKAEQYRYIDLRTNGHFVYHSHYFYPNVSVSTNIGASQLSLSYAMSSSKPYITLSMIKKADIKAPLNKAKHLLEEHISTTTMKWSMAWLTTTISHRYHSDPLFSTTSSSLKYNWDAYNEIDAGITLSPTIKFWQPSLMVNVHKQWLDLSTAKNDDILSLPLVTANWTNSATFPHMWMARINATWHSRGADRNIYYYSRNLNLDISLQKSFTKPRLTFELSVSNLLHQSYDDVTIFNANNIGVSEGYKLRKPRIASLSAKWEM